MKEVHIVTDSPTDRVLNARRRGSETWQIVTGTRPSGDHWCVSGSAPIFGDRETDEKRAFRVIRNMNDRHIGHVSVLIPKALGGYNRADAFFAERGYTQPFFRRSRETPDDTDRRRQRTAISRLRSGLPVSRPNKVRRGA